MSKACGHVSYGKGKYAVSARMGLMGSDRMLLIDGGEKPHAGCVVICEPDRASGGVSTSVHTFATHREELVARPIAESVCRKAKARVVCVCGIHVENASAKEIALLVKNTQELGKRILKCI